MAKEGDLYDWRKFKVLQPLNGDTPSKSVVDVLWALSWEMFDGENDGKAHWVSKGRQDPDLRDGSANTSGRVSLRPSHLQVISLATINKMEFSESGHHERLLAI